MKNYNKALIISLLIVIFVGLISCNSQTNTNNPTESKQMLVSAEYDNQDFYLPDGQILDDALALPTDDETMGFGDAKGLTDNKGPVSDRQFRDNFLFLGRILAHLQLGQDQLIPIRKLLREYHDCVADAMAHVRLVKMEIMHKYGAAREHIIKKLRAGEINREQARAHLDKLNQHIRAELQNNDVIQAAHARICECLRELFHKIRATLNEKQAAIWDKWVANLKHPCLSTGLGDHK